TLNEANSWEATITNLPKYENGVEITYTWIEGSIPEGYALTGTSVNGTITTLTNSYEPETTQATIKKVWEDADNQDGKRPAELKVTLSNGTEVTLSEANGWEATVTNLPKYENGVEITYTWTEGEMPEGYELTETSVNGTITTLTNSYEPETTQATIKKVWDDADNQDGKRPAELKVTLSNGTEVTLNAANSWEATVTDLPKYENGVEITYTWTEGEMPEGYALTGTGVNGTITTLKNSYDLETTSVAVKKVWDDRNNQGGSRPDSLVVKLLADDHDTGLSVTLSESNDWYAELNGLAKHNAGKEIEYTWAEIDVPAYYKQTDKSVNGMLTTFTNTYSAEGRIQFAGTKTIEGRKMTADDVFTFEIWEKLTNGDGEEQEVLLGTVTNDAPGGKINYPAIEYTLDDVGTHIYLVKETSENGNGITVDAKTYAVVVIVADNGDGTLSVVSSENAAKLDFVNSYDANGAFTFTAFKTLDGNEPADDQVFNFICRDEQTMVELAAQNENGSITFAPIRFGLEDVDKTFTYTIWEATGSSEYVIADDAVYTVYLTIRDAGNGTLRADHVIERNGEAADKVIFDNRAVAPLTISKKVENVQTDETFEMVVHFFDNDGNELTQAFAFTGDAEGEIVSGGSIELGHDQSVTIHGLPVGTRYTVKEEGSLAYTATVNGEEGREIDDEIIPDENNRVDFVNIMETTTFSVTKVWDDGRSDDIQLTLYANGERMDPQPAYTRQGSMYVYDNLPWYDENGEVIVYSAKEKGIEGYLTIYNNIDPYKDVTKFIHDGGTIINRPEQVKELSFQIRKIWNNMNGEEPPKIELKLYCNGVEMNKPTPKPDRNGWYKYYNLPKVVNGQPAVYTVLEVPLSGFATFYEDENGIRIEYGVNGGTIVNSKLPETGDSQSVAMWMLMLSISLGSVLLMMKRKAKA
ncbi:MAG: Cna B-type domain-containing protein, partial [Clostridia bacterium]|nr:Cna B-type domain-containing protein [Clostridia bacterium]